MHFGAAGLGCGGRGQEARRTAHVNKADSRRQTYKKGVGGPLQAIPRG